MEGSVPDTAVPAPGSPRRAVWIRFALFVLATKAAFAWAFFVHGSGIPMCAFKIVTGRPCPGCGMTRSIVALCHGDLATSLRYHPLGVVLAGVLLFLLAGSVIGLTGRADPAWAWMRTRGTKWAVVFAAALVVLWIVRGFVVPSWSPDPIGGVGGVPPEEPAR